MIIYSQIPLELRCPSLLASLQVGIEKTSEIHKLAPIYNQLTLILEKVLWSQ